MAWCSLSSITAPTSTSSYQVGASVNVTWNYSGGSGCNDWNVRKITLQSNYSGSWSNVSVLFSGFDPVTSGSKSVTLPSSVTNEGDYYRLKVEYDMEEFEP